MKVWLSGALLDEAEARISPFDRGFLLGDAVFETLRAYRGRPYGLDAHLARLRGSCEATRIPYPADLPDAVARVLAANALPDAAIRITVSRGPGGRGASPAGAGPPTVLVTATPVPHRPEVYERGLRVATTSRKRVPDASIPARVKSTNYLAHVLARLEAEDAGADEALFLDDAGRVVEATQANVFAVLDGTLATPPLGSGCLPGETRAALLALAPGADLRPEERPLAIPDLLASSEVLLTASLLEVAPVVALDGAPIGDGRPGPHARKLRALYRKHAGSDFT